MHVAAIDTAAMDAVYGGSAPMGGYADWEWLLALAHQASDHTLHTVYGGSAYTACTAYSVCR